MFRIMYREMKDSDKEKENGKMVSYFYTMGPNCLVKTVKSVFVFYCCEETPRPALIGLGLVSSVVIAGSMAAGGSGAGEVASSCSAGSREREGACFELLRPHSPLPVTHFLY